MNAGNAPPVAPTVETLGGAGIDTSDGGQGEFTAELDTLACQRRHARFVLQ